MHYLMRHQLLMSDSQHLALSPVRTLRTLEIHEINSMSSFCPEAH